MTGHIRLLLAAACAGALAAPTAAEAGLTGVVVDVAAGDVLKIRVRSHVLKVHLRDVDAPEPGEPYAARAQASLAEICAHATARVDDIGIEPRRHVVADIECGGVDAGAEQVRRGMAWVHEKSAPTDSPLYPLQDQARALQRGVWSVPR